MAVAAGGQAAKKAAAALQKEAARLSAEEQRREQAEAEALLAKARARRMAQEQEEGQGRPQGGVFLWAHLYAANCQTHFNDGTGRCAPVVFSAGCVIIIMVGVPLAPQHEQPGYTQEDHPPYDSTSTDDLSTCRCVVSWMSLLGCPLRWGLVRMILM